METRSDLKQERSFFCGSVSTFLQVVVATLICTLPAAINSRSSIKKITFNLDCLHSNHTPEKKSSLKQLHPKISLILLAFDYM